MVLANGFISKTKFDVIDELRKRINGRDIQPIPLPYTVETMTYYISDIGEVFGFQKYKDFYLTKPLKIKKRYKTGCHIRIALGHQKAKQEWMQNLMYWTWIAKEYLEDIQINFKDNDHYNYQLNNIQLATPKSPTILKGNMEMFKNEYNSHFLDVAWYARAVDKDISLDDAKDIASAAFYELCKKDYPYRLGYFIGLWKVKVRQRALDFSNYKKRFYDVELDDNKERFIAMDNVIDIVDFTKHISGNKARKTIELWLQGETTTEIAKLMGCSSETTKSCISRNIKKLKQIYKKDIEICKTKGYLRLKK